MAKKQMEQVIDLLITYVSANIAAKITTINSDYTDNVNLSNPLTSSYIFGEIDIIQNYPAIQFVPDVSDVALNGLQHDETDHKLFVVCHVNSVNGSTAECAKRCLRLVRAVWETLLDNRTLGDNVIECFATGFNYKPMMSDGHSLKQEAWIDVTVKTEER